MYSITVADWFTSLRLVLNKGAILRAIAVIAIMLVGLTSGSVDATPLQAEQITKAVTNADVIAMTTAKLSDDIIIRAVHQATTTNFDLSPGALIALKNTGVSDRVIQAMQARREEAAQPDEAQLTTTRSLSGTAADASASEPCRIFITEEDPPSRLYVVIRKEMQAKKNMYLYSGHDPHDYLMRALAKQADKVGADAIIRLHNWTAPSAWSDTAAKVSGMAVKWTAEGKTAASALKGQCWSLKE